MKRIFCSIASVAAVVAALCLASCVKADVGEPVYGADVVVVEGALDFDGEGDRKARIYVVTNINDWTAEKSADWVKFYTGEEQEAELRKQRIVEVWVEDNDDTENGRTATITITAGDFSRTLTVTQQAGMPSIVLDSVAATYSGDTELDGRGQYDLTFTYGEFDENGNPLGDDAGILNVACLNGFVPGVYAPEAEAGVYYVASGSSVDIDALEFVAGDLSGASPTGTYHTTYSDGVPSVNRITGGRFEIAADGTFIMRFHYGETIKRFVYSGPVSYENREALSAVGAYSQEDGKPVNYDLRLYVGKMERNRITGYGYEIFLECWNSDMYEGSYMIPPGNYTVGDGRSLTFSAGTADGGSRLMIYEPAPEDDVIPGAGGSGSTAPQTTPITGGTLSVARDLDVYTVTFDLTTADGRRAKGQYTGEIRFRNS
jgi:hypothetical protein